MAERRMFAKTIIDSDAFLDMPQSSQLLYFHLAMRADDDGFINNPKSIMRNCNCSADDLKLLAMKKFIIPFESGIVVIKHWKIHNYIAKDRYKETKYKDEKRQLQLDDNNSYTTCIQPVDSLETQDRLGKDRLGKDRLNKERVDYDGVKNAYNSLCPSLPAIKALSDFRKRAIKARLKDYTLEDLREAFKLAEGSNFLKGENERSWKANFDWLMKEANLAKVLEGNYKNKEVVKNEEPKLKLGEYF